MKIALLNLPYDNNYGGNLQRFALMKVLQDMGHDVTHINLRFHWQLPWYKKPFVYAKRAVRKVFIDHGANIFIEQELNERYCRLCKVTDPFYEKYVVHTKSIVDIKELSTLKEYDAFVVGSDQVWRKTIAAKRLSTMFLDFLGENNQKKIAFAVSFGTDKNELNSKEIIKLGRLYRRFDAVSVRETSGLKLLEEYGWKRPPALHLLDPTFLISKDSYREIIKASNFTKRKGILFCYILDTSEKKIEIINEISRKRKLLPNLVSLNDNVSIEQWLSFFDEAEYVVTDSYHGLVFSLIFNKPFHLIRNFYRGNSRFESLLSTFGLNDDIQNIDWNICDRIILDYKYKAMSFLAGGLK